MSAPIAVIVSQNSAKSALNSLEEEINKIGCRKSEQLEYDLAQLKGFLRSQAGGARRKTTRRKARKSRKSRSRK
jgi:hypothetical protein